MHPAVKLSSCELAVDFDQESILVRKGLASFRICKSQEHYMKDTDLEKSVWYQKLQYYLHLSITSFSAL